MNNEEKRKSVFTWRVAVVFLFIFGMGVLFGNIVDFNKITSLEGYLFNLNNIVESSSLAEATSSNATDSNATSCNATSSNATDCNATSSNATECNATSSNASEANGEIYLEKFNLKATSGNLGDKLYINISTTGDELNSASVIFKNNSNGATIEAEIKDLNKNPYIIIPSNAAITSYTIDYVFLEGKTTSGITFTKYYSNFASLGAEVFDFGNIKLEVNKKVVSTNTETTNTTVNNLKLNSINIVNSIVKVGNDVKINIDSSTKLISAKLIFKSTTTSDSFTVYAKSLDNNPYITIPTGTKALEYKLNSVMLESDESTKLYGLDTSVSGVEKLNFDVRLKVEENTHKTTLEYNNENITDKVLSEISKAEEKTITINADGKSIISGSLFNAIKGKDKELVIKYKGNELIFNGKDITVIKDMDVSVSVYSTSNDEVKETIGSLINNGIVIDYKANGTLPGKALVRIKADDNMTKEIGNNNIYVYYFNETSNKFELIAEKVKLSEDGYYEFSIAHNSKYVLIRNELDSSLVSETAVKEDVVSFVQSNTTYILLVVLAIVVIVTVTIILIVNRKKHKNNL